MTDWHPSMGPSDTVLHLCDECGKYVVSLLEHYSRKHPTRAATERRERMAAYMRERRHRLHTR